jgi:hypothetical protein
MLAGRTPSLLGSEGMRALAMLVLWLGAVQLVRGVDRSFDLSQHPVNSLPKEFKSVITGQGKPGEWKIVPDNLPSMMPAINPQTASTTPGLALAQLATDRTDEHFPLLILGEDHYTDFAASTKFKIVSGQQEQMAGLAFRIQDERNYYVVRASVLGRNLRFYKFVNGQRSEPIGVDLDVSAGNWHELKVDCKGSVIRIYLDGKEPIPALTDYSFTGGKVGLWTKSDTIAHFAETRISYIPREKLADILVRRAMEKHRKLLGVKIYAYTGQPPQLKIIASSKQDEIGSPGADVERDVIGRDLTYAGKTGVTASATLPLHDRNGEVVAAVRVVMSQIRGQSDQQILSRALPIIKAMEPGIRSLDDLIAP